MTSWCYHIDWTTGVYQRFFGGCVRNFTSLNPCDMSSHPIVEPYYHCYPGIAIPLILSLFGILVFYLYLRTVLAPNTESFSRERFQDMLETAWIWLIISAGVAFVILIIWAFMTDDCKAAFGDLCGML